MKVYFASSGQFYKDHKELYDKIISSIEKHSGKEPYIALGDIDYEKDSETDIVQSVNKMEKQLKHADVVITENSFSKAGIGFDIATALSLKKPVLVLDMNPDTAKKGPHPINTLNYKYLSYKDYTLESIEQTIKSFLQAAKQKIDTKFILIISPEIERYLEWSSDQRRMHKAQVVRQAVEDAMEKDKEYQEYFKEEFGTEEN